MSSNMVRVSKITFLPALAICLLISLIFSPKIGALQPIDYCLYIENNTAENLIIFVDGELDSVVRSHETSDCVASWIDVVDIKYQEDINIELKNGLGDVVYHAYIEAEELESEDMTLVIPSSVGAPSFDSSGMQNYAIRIHNPSDERVVVLINGIPVDVIAGHVGIYSSCWLCINEEGDSQQLIEAKNSEGTLISSLMFALSEISSNRYIITLSPSTPVTFSLNFVNLSSQSLDISIDHQPIGSIMPDTKKLFDELEVEPRMEWKSDRRATWEQYLIEAKSSENTVYYSKDISWFTFDLGSEEQKWTIVIPPKLSVRNLTSEMITVYVEGTLMGDLAPSQEEYYYGYRMTSDYSLWVWAENQSGQEIFFKIYSYEALQDLNWLLEIMPFNWNLIWSIISSLVVLVVVFWLIFFHRMTRKGTAENHLNSSVH